RLVRPRPAAALASALAGRRNVAVIDQNLSPGLGGILFQEVAGALAGAADRPRLHSFVAGLGGKDISPAEFDHVLEVIERGGERQPATTGKRQPAAIGEPGEPFRERLVESELLLTESEWRLVRQRLALAGHLEPDLHEEAAS
ncbi:MAG: hypothetical protein J5I93_28350, partial [Pirellulaceae bacterium]|nr:hypothetical protein [Pirellulaceae bacterium]